MLPPRPSSRALVVIAAATFCAGCLYVAPESAPNRGASTPAQSSSGAFSRDPSGQLSQEQLAELVQGFADRYYALVSSACDELSKLAKTPEERLLIDRLQSRTISAVFDIASNPDPYSQLLDLTVVVTLTAMVVIDEARYDELLGSSERAQVLKTPLFKAQEDVWDVAARALTAEQLELLDRLIREWRKANPEVESVSYVRFDDFAEGRGKSTIADVRTGSGLLAPVDEANKAVNEARLFAERAFYMAKRAPLIVSMEVGHLLSQVAATPEVGKLVDVGDRLATSADRISTVAESLPKTIAEERQEVVSSIETTSSALQASLERYESAVIRTDELIGSVHALSDSTQNVLKELDTTAKALTSTIEAADQLAQRFGHDPDLGPPKPIDPEIYVQMMADLRGSLVEVNKALEQTRTLAEGALWEKPIAAAEKVVKDRTADMGLELRGVVDVVFARTLTLVCAVFVLLFAHTAWSHWLRRRSARGANASPEPKVTA